MGNCLRPPQAVQKCFRQRTSCDSKTQVQNQRKAGARISFFNFTVPEPTGVVAVVAPSESGLLGLLAAITPVITGGNACVALAASGHPLCAVSLAETLHTADIPDGVVNLLTGFRSDLLEPFATHMDVNALVYFGDESAEITQVESSAAENTVRVYGKHLFRMT